MRLGRDHFLKTWFHGGILKLGNISTLAYVSHGIILQVFTKPLLLIHSPDFFQNENYDVGPGIVPNFLN